MINPEDQNTRRSYKNDNFDINKKVEIIEKL